MSRVLITGGAGYIGSHCAVELIRKGHDVVILDNFSASRRNIIQRIETIVGRSVDCVEGDVADIGKVRPVLQSFACDSVIHTAGLKSLSQSVEDPLAYYRANLEAAMSLLEAMRAESVRSLIFSSSASVYGGSKTLPIAEDYPRLAAHPYGQTKIMIEQMLQDIAASDPSWRISVLRFANPCGADKSGVIGETYKDSHETLVPNIAKVASEPGGQLTIYGSSYETSDRTSVRDYIHITDVARAHLASLDFLKKSPGFHVFNIGTGRGTSVLQMVNVFKAVSKRDIPYFFAPPRNGDVPTVILDSTLAHTKLGWQAERGILEICEDHWRHEAYARDNL